MKKIIPALALLLALALPLSGCAAMLERAWSGSETHVDYPVVEDDSTLRVGNYQGLVNALLYYVNEHSAAGSVQMYNYAGEAEEDLERARAQVVEQDPLAAYTVRSLTYDVTRILTYYEVDVRITYAHTAQEIDAIRTVSGMAGLTAELERMADEREGQSVLLLSGFSGDGALLDELFRLAWYGDPARGEPDPPRFQAGFYPAEGARRVVELDLNWGRLPAGSGNYAARLDAAASALLEAFPPTGESYTLEELAALLRDNALYEENGSDLALAALTGEPVSQKGLVLAMEYLCRRCGAEVLPVVGQNGALWLIAAAPEGYRHLPAQGLIATDGSDDPEAEPDPLLYTDGGMKALGYQWRAELYPACPEPEPVPTEPPGGDPAPEQTEAAGLSAGAKNPIDKPETA